MRIAIITGGSKGLGKELCLQLMSAGYQVKDLSRTAPHPFSSRVDLATTEAVQAAVASALADIFPGDYTEVLFFNNAGTLAPIGPAWRKLPTEVYANLNTNFTSAVAVIAQIMGHFRNVAGRKLIVNVTSGAALKGYAGWSLYCASKAGMEGFIRALAVEEMCQPHPFLTISIDPGVIDTDMQALIRETLDEDFPEVARFTRRKLEGGLLPASEVATAILQLISSKELQPGERYAVQMGMQKWGQT